MKEISGIGLEADISVRSQAAPGKEEQSWHLSGGGSSNVRSQAAPGKERNKVLQQVEGLHVL